jgi:hypothetical protein
MKTISKRMRICILVGCFMCLLIVLFPPIPVDVWGDYKLGEAYHKGVGREFLFSIYNPSKILLLRMVLEIFLVCLIVLITYFLIPVVRGFFNNKKDFEL